MLSVREQYNIPKDAKAADYFDDILNTFPFLRLVTDNCHDLMYIESQIMITAMSELNKIGVVTYPVHDCLMCKRTDEETVISSIQKAMIARLGTTIMMDVSYSDLPTKLIPPLTETKTLSKAKPKPHLIDPDDDFDVLEDF